jgi:dihydrofolate reductase
MSGDDDVIGGEIETPIAFVIGRPIAFVIGRVSEEDTSGGPGCQFMRCLDGEVGIAGATKHSQVLIGGGDTVESDIGAGCADHFIGKTVQQICGSVEPFYPVASQERSLKEQGANHVINGAESTLGFTVLRRSVGAGHPQNHPMSGEECSRGGVVELPTVVALDIFDGAAKLCGVKGEIF